MRRLIDARRSGGGRVGGADGGGEHPGVEAGAIAGVAGRADLVDGDEQRITVAVEPNALDPLDVTARVALAPVLLPTARPEGDSALGQGAVQRLVVHPPDHEHIARVVLLDDSGDEAVLVALEQGGDVRAEGGGVGHPDILPPPRPAANNSSGAGAGRWSEGETQTACCWATQESCSLA